jgi:hypothetical protein
MKQPLVLILIFYTTLLLSISGPASAQEAGVYQISSPADGQNLFGLVEIQGTASHPSLFDSYSLEWSNAANPAVWLPIQAPIRQQVSNGILGQWDTVAGGIPDGVYQIRLLVFLSDGTVQTAEVRNLILANAAPTPLPTVNLAPPTLNAGPLIGPTATGLILQPPTLTPAPTFPGLAAEAPPVQPVAGTGGEGEAILFDAAAAQGAFCQGVFFSLGLFAVVIVYLLLRRQLSPFTRRIWWQLRHELDNSRQE